MLLNGGLWFWCWMCGAAPAWPKDGAVDAHWVEEALEWRLRTGLDCCGETAKAVDALTLEWIADSDALVVHVQTADWPVLRHYQELKTPLIQRLALAQLRSETVVEEDVLRTLRKVVRRTDGLKYRRVKMHLKPTQSL